MHTRPYFLLFILNFTLHSLFGLNDLTAVTPNPNANYGYSLVIEGFDWGPAASRVILDFEGQVPVSNWKDFTVLVERHTDCFMLPAEQSSGSRSVIHSYISDASGNFQDQGNFLTLVLAVSPNDPLCSPIQYSRNEDCRGNNWIDYKLVITDLQTQKTWKHETHRILPQIDRFNLKGKFTDDTGLTMSYAFYDPHTAEKPNPLIIWLHGGGEGGTDPSIPLIANRAANYASDEIQAFFGNAHVLVPQCPGAWMHNAQGVSTHGSENDIYNKALMSLIEDYVKKHPDIDRNRIYIGGCSNGGYMSLKLILLYPDYFAAGFISALAYQSQYITDEEIQRIKHVPIWFVHSKDDPVTIPEKTVIPVYNRLIAAGSENTHFTFYDHVTDITGLLGGENYRYNGHWSWIYCHANKCSTDFDGHPVMIDKHPVTIMEWVANQTKK